jgi:hypothetical protein
MASFMSSLTGLSMYGMKGDPTNAGAAMSAADAAMRNGGQFGEASKNFSLGLWQRQLSGFTAFDQDFMNEQGAFGNIGKAFGRDSAAYKLAEARGDKAKMAQYDQWVGQGGDRSVMAMQMQAIEQFYGRDTDEFRKAIQSHFGVGAGQASALYQAYKTDRGLGGLEKQLTASGVDISRMNTKQIAAVAEVALSDDSGVRKQADRLKRLDGADKLKAGDAAALNTAMASGDDDELRNVVVRLTAAYDSTRDEGERARQTQSDMANSLQKLATELIPATLDIREGIADMVKGLVGETEFSKKVDEERAKKQAADEGRELKSDAEVQSFQKLRDVRSKIAAKEETLEQETDPFKRKILETEIGVLQEEARDAEADVDRRSIAEKINGGAPKDLGAGPVSHGKHSLTEDQRAQLWANDRELGLPSGTLEAQMRVESGLNPNAVSKAGARGYAQLMPETQASLEKRWGRKIDPSNFDDAARAQKELMAENLRKFGNAQDAMRAYNVGWDRSRWGNPETSAYPGKIERARRAIAGDVAADVRDGRVPEKIKDAARAEVTSDADRKIADDVQAAALAGAPDGRVPEKMRETTAGGGGAQQVSLNVGGRFELYDQSGNERAQPIISTSFGAPRPAGVFA